MLRILALLLGIVGSVAIARLGGPEVKGVASAFAAANALSFAFIGFDLPHQALRRTRESGDLRLTSRVLTKAWALYILLGSLVIAVLMTLTVPGEWLVIGAVTYLLVSHAAIAATGLHGAVVAAWGAVIQQAAMIVVTVAFAMFDVLTIDSVRYVIVASYLIPMAYYAKYLVAGPKAERGYGIRELGEVARAGIPWQLARIPQMLLLKIDTVVVFIVLGSATAGVYSVGLSLAMLCTIVPAQFAASSLHQVTRGTTSRPSRHVLLAAAAGLVTACGLGLVGLPAIEILYGSDFRDAYPVMLACLLGACAYGVMQVQSNYIRILGVGRHLMTTNLIGLIVMLFSFVVLIPAYGAVGAGISFSLGCATTAAVTLIFRKRFFPT